MQEAKTNIHGEDIKASKKSPQTHTHIQASEPRVSNFHLGLCSDFHQAKHHACYLLQYINTKYIQWSYQNKNYFLNYSKLTRFRYIPKVQG